MPPSISNRKLKQIRRLAADSASLEEIAKAVNLPIADIEAVLRPAGGAPGQAGPNGPGHDAQTIVGWIIVVGLFLAPLMHSTRLYNLSNLPQQAFFQTFAVVAAVTACVHAWVTRERRFLVRPGLWFVLAFIGWAGISFIWAHNTYEFLYTFGQWLGCALLWVALSQCLRTTRWQDSLLLLVFAIGLTQAVVGLAQYYLVPPAPLPTDAFLFGLRQFLASQISKIPQVAPPSGTFANKNFAVHVVVPAVALGIAHFFRESRRRLVWLFAVGTALMVTYLWHTGTRAGWLAFALQLLVWTPLLVWQRRRLVSGWSRDKSIALPVAIAALLVLMHLTPEGFKPTLKPQLDRIQHELAKLPAFFRPQPKEVAPEEVVPETSTAEAVEPAPWSFANLPMIKIPPRPAISTGASFLGRIKVWRNTLYMIRDNPFIGVGLGNFNIYFPLYDGRSDGQPMFDDRIQLESSHNDFVQVWAELGTIGLVLAGAMVVFFLLILRRLLRGDSQVWWQAAGVLTAGVGMALNAFFSSPMQKAIPAVILVLLSIWTTCAWGRERAPKAWRTPTWFTPTMAAVGVVAFILVANLEVRRLQADHEYVYMTAASKANRWDICELHALKGAELLPIRTKIFAFLGKSYLETAKDDVGLKKAITEFNRTLEAYPNTPNTLFDVGVCYAKLIGTGTGDNAANQAKALEYYERVRKLVPTYPRLYNNMAAVYLSQKKIPEAIEAFRVEAALNPDNEKVLANLGLALLQTADRNRPEEFLNAETAITRALRLAPDNADLWRNLGLACIECKHLEEAEKAFRKAIELNPDFVLAYRNLAFLLANRLNRVDEARKYMQLAQEAEARLKAKQQP